MIYLDYNASTPLRPEAKEAIIHALDLLGNPSSPHGLGRRLRSRIDDARAQILEITKGDRVIFTGGGTEANVLALRGLNLPVLTSAIEHDSVQKSVSNPHIIPVNGKGIVDLDALEMLLNSFEKPGLLSVMLVNNETGVIQPLAEATRLAHAKGWTVHTDATQAVGHVPISFDTYDVDLMTLSSHKCGGPVGVGAIVMKDNIHLEPIIPGGGQEYGMRSGTLSTPLILGFTEALKVAINEDQERLRVFQSHIENSLPEARVFGSGAHRTPHVSCLGMPGVPTELQIIAFDIENIAISAGSACSSGKMKVSHVLTSMGVPYDEARCAIRVSFGWATQASDIDAFIKAWKTIYSSQKMRDVS